MNATFLKHSRGNPQEPDFVAELVNSLPQDIYNTLKVYAPHFQYAISGIFCHQKPLANYVGVKNPELEQITSASQGRFHETDILDISDIIKKVVALYDKDYERFMQVYNLISQTVDTLPFIPTDKIVVEEILTCFNRPAFTVAFRDECNLGDFDVAIKNTISLINTGKSADGMSLKYNVSDVNDKATKERMSEIVLGLNYLRKVFAEMKTRGYATGCKCGDPKCKVIFNNDFEFCCLMNDLRLVVLFFADKLAQSVDCDFNVFPEYMDIREYGETSEKLRVCMNEVYLYHNAKLSR